MSTPHGVSPAMSFLKYAALFAMYTQSGEPVEPPTFDLPPVAQTGAASWYGDGAWHGETTANGEPFQPYHPTCAHRNLPFDTVILLESKRSGQRAWCRVNDRGPYGALDQDGQWQVSLTSSETLAWRGILDMSIATAESLGSRALGLRSIHIRHWGRRARPAPFNLAAWSP